MVGGRGDPFNRCVQAKRQPGSTFKPFVWAAALNAGMTGMTLVAGVAGCPVSHSLSPTLHNSCIREAGLDAVYVALGPGPHGFTEALYAYVSGAANNGSAFAGLSANTLWWNTSLGFDMLIGRFFVIIPALAIAGSLAAKKTVPPSSGTFPTDGPLFVLLVAGVILIVGGLTFFPALALGPIVEHLAMVAGTTW